MEIWKDIEGFEGLYQISSYGRVKSLNYWNRGHEKVLKQTPDKDGYMMIGLHKGGRPYTRKVHRLVAMAFIPNPENLPQVNHKDEIKDNNNVDNLEWCTNQYNLNYGLHNFHNAEAQRGKRHTAEHIMKIRMNAPLSKPVLMIDDNTGEIIADFVSASEAARQIKGTATNISFACRNGTRYRGLRWQYKPV